MEEEALPVGDEGAREAADIAPEVADMPPEADDQAPDSVEGAPGRIERPRGYRVALVLHLASLAAALVVLLVINRHMWFRGDDFDFLSQRGLHGATYSLWYPHNVHWSTVPILIWRGLFYFAGLRTAVPYLLVLYLANLLLAHLVWRVMLSSGAGPFVATGGCCMLLLFGPGAENLIWAFQIGFVLSLVGGFAMTALGDGSPSLRRLVPAGLLGVPMMMTSAIALPMLVMAGLSWWLRSGWRRAVVVVAPGALTYAVWYVLAGRHARQVPYPLSQSLPHEPRSVASGIWHAATTSVDSEVGGAVLLVALVGWAALNSRRREQRTQVAPALAGVIAIPVFFALVSLGRDSLGVSRYVDITATMFLPAVATGVTQLARLGRRFNLAGLAVPAVAAGLAGVVAWQNFSTLLTNRDSFTSLSIATERQLMAASRLAGTQTTLSFDRPVLNLHAPNITVTVMGALAKGGELPTGVDPDATDYANAVAETQLGLSGTPVFPVGSGATIVPTADPECEVALAPMGHQLVVRLTASGPVSLRVWGGSGATGQTTLAGYTLLDGRLSLPNVMPLGRDHLYLDDASAMIVVLVLPPGGVLGSCTSS